MIGDEFGAFTCAYCGGRFDAENLFVSWDERNCCEPCYRTESDTLVEEQPGDPVLHWWPELDWGTDVT